MNETDSSSNDRIEILGQKISYPNTGWAALSVTVVALSICAIVYMLNYGPKALEIHSGTFSFSTGQLTQGGNIESTGQNYLIQFWTPSAKTKNTKAEDIEPWEKLENDDKVISFGNTLLSEKQKRINGFRRYEVYGAGLGGQKFGYWWVVNVTRDYKLAEFKETYRAFWKNEKNIYIEILREGGRQER